MTKHYRDMAGNYLTGTADDDPVPDGGIESPAPAHGRQKFVSGAWADDTTAEDAFMEAQAETLLSNTAKALIDVFAPLLIAADSVKYPDEAAVRQKVKQRIKARM